MIAVAGLALGAGPQGPPPAGLRHDRAGRARRHRPDRPPPGGHVMTRAPQPRRARQAEILVRAGEADVDILSQVIAEAFFDLAPSRWLIAGPGRPPRDLPRLLPAVRRARAGRRGRAHHPGPRRRRAVAPRRPGAPARPVATTRGWPRSPAPGRPVRGLRRGAGRPPPGRRRRTTTWPSSPSARAGRARAPAPPCSPPATPRSTPSGIPAYLEASGPDSRRLYLRHGYADYGPRIDLPGGPALYPMWRQPHDPQDAGRRR